MLGLVVAVIGVGGTLLGVRMTLKNQEQSEKRRLQHENKVRWHADRLQAYASFLISTRETFQFVIGVAEDGGVWTTPTFQFSKTSKKVAQLNQRMAELAEATTIIGLVADGAVGEAAAALGTCVSKVFGLVVTEDGQHLVKLSSERVAEIQAEYDEAYSAFLAAVRVELEVVESE